MPHHFSISKVEKQANEIEWKNQYNSFFKFHASIMLNLNFKYQ